MTETQLRFQAGVPRAGYGPPSLELGSRGDFYYDLTNTDFYGPKRDTWGEPISIVGPPGQTGAPGAAGSDGEPGADAYSIAVANGYSGSEAQWLASLEGDPGSPGQDGDDAYEVAVANGFSGSRLEWLTSLKGEPGDPGPATVYKNTKVGLDLTWVNGTSVNISPGVAYIPSVGGTVELASPVTLSPGSNFLPSTMAANTFYYVYLIALGNIAVSTMPPVKYHAGAKHEQGNNSRRYIGALLTSSDGSRFLRSMRFGDEVRYIEDIDSNNAGTPHKLRLLRFSAASNPPPTRTRQVVSASLAVPAGASAAIINATIGTVGNLWLDYNVQNKTAYQGFQQMPQNTAPPQVLVPLDESRRFVYSITDGPTGATSFDTVGYVEPLA